MDMAGNFAGYRFAIDPSAAVQWPTPIPRFPHQPDRLYLEFPTEPSSLRDPPPAP